MPRWNYINSKICMLPPLDAACFSYLAVENKKRRGFSLTHAAKVSRFAAAENKLTHLFLTRRVDYVSK
jgi:hypothetical protein